MTRRELAALLGVHMMTVTKWEQDGLPVAVRGRRGKPSRYRELEVRAWLQQREEAAKASPLVDIAQERARKERAQAILTEQTYAMRERLLIPREEVERTWLAETMAVRAKLLAIPITYGDRIFRAATLEGLAGVERTLTEIVREVLTELAAPDRKPSRRRRRTKRSSDHAEHHASGPGNGAAPVAATA